MMRDTLYTILAAFLALVSTTGLIVMATTPNPRLDSPPLMQEDAFAQSLDEAIALRMRSLIGKTVSFNWSTSRTHPQHASSEP